jgi:aryl-alcohol dehydrogenase-like predicted oxidoreductase
MLRPCLHLGTMTFGWGQASAVVNHTVVSQMLESFASAGGSSLDFARVYADGDSETMAGLATRSHTVSLDLLLALSHVRSRSSCVMVSPSVNVSRCLALFPCVQI